MISKFLQRIVKVQHTLGSQKACTCKTHTYSTYSFQIRASHISHMMIQSGNRLFHIQSHVAYKPSRYILKASTEAKASDYHNHHSSNPKEETRQTPPAVHIFITEHHNRTPNAHKIAKCVPNRSSTRNVLVKTTIRNPVLINT